MRNDSMLHADYDRTRRSARGAREDVKDGYQDAKNNARGAYYDAKDGVKESYDDAKDSVKDTWNDAKHSVQDTYNDAKDSVRDTKRNVKDKYNETSRDISRNIEHAKQSWQDSLTPHSYVSVPQLCDRDSTVLTLHPCSRSSVRCKAQACAHVDWPFEQQAVNPIATFAYWCSTLACAEQSPFSWSCHSAHCCAMCVFDCTAIATYNCASQLL